MYNILMIENINNKSIFILNLLSSEIPEVKIFKITSNIDEISKVLKNHLVDFVIVDENIDNFKNILACIRLYSYENYLIIINNEISSCINKIKNFIFPSLNTNDTLKQLINIELKNLNYNFSYLGTRYLSDAIYEAYYRCKDFDINLNTDIYPILSKKYNKSINNIKSNIYYSTNMMYYDTEANKLGKSIGLNIDFKPKLRDIMILILQKICNIKN